MRDYLLLNKARLNKISAFQPVMECDPLKQREDKLVELDYDRAEGFLFF